MAAVKRTKQKKERKYPPDLVVLRTRTRKKKIVCCQKNSNPIPNHLSKPPELIDVVLYPHSYSPLPSSLSRPRSGNWFDASPFFVSFLSGIIPNCYHHYGVLVTTTVSTNLTTPYGHLRHPHRHHHRNPASDTGPNVAKHIATCTEYSVRHGGCHFIAATVAYRVRSTTSI